MSKREEFYIEIEKFNWSILSKYFNSLLGCLFMSLVILIVAVVPVINHIIVYGLKVDDEDLKDLFIKKKIIVKREEIKKE